MNSNKCYSFRPHEKLTFEVNEHTKYIDSSDLAISYIKGAVSLREVRNWHQSSPRTCVVIAGGDASKGALQNA